MRLTEIGLRNFKAFEDAHLRLAPLTVLIGPNNAGKSTVLQALGILAQSVNTPTPNPRGSVVDLGDDWRRLINVDAARAGGEGWGIELGWQDEVRQRPGFAKLDPAAAGLPVSIRFRYQTTTEVGRQNIATRTVVTYFPTALRQVDIIADFVDGRASYLVQTRARPNSTTEQWVADFGDTLQAGGQPWYITPQDATYQSEPVNFGAVGVGDRRAVQLFSQTVAYPYLSDGGIPTAVASYRYVGPDRHVTHSSYGLQAQKPGRPTGPAELVAVLAYDDELRARISERCKRIFDFEIAWELLPGPSGALVALRRGRKINVVNVGTGLLQMLWIAVQLEWFSLESQGIAPYLPLVPTAGLEEPELHLHPRVQPQIAKLLVDYVTGGVQVLVTTQSEHFLTSVLQMVLADELPRESLSVYYVDNATALELLVDEKGRLSGGLRGFFEANEAELRKQLELLSKSAE